MQMSADFAYKHLEHICSIGPRPAGTPEETITRDYLSVELKKLGLPARLETFNYLHFKPQASNLEITVPVSRFAESLPLQYCTPGVVEGILVNAGSGTKEDFHALERQGVKIEGSIVLVSGIFILLNYKIAESFGAAGYIGITNPPEGLIRAGIATNSRIPGKIPGVTVSLQTGNDLLSLLESYTQVQIRLTVEGCYSKRESWNIAAELPGASSEEIVVLGSHYDSHALGPHAWDNASANAALLEVARALSSGDKLRRKVEFVFFGVEEQGSFGSYAYWAKHEDKLKDLCVGMFNFDGFSSVLCEKNIVEITPEIKQFILSNINQSNWPIHEIIEPPTPLSDHLPFSDNGIPSVWIHEGLIDPYYHTEKDIIEHIEKQGLIRTIGANIDGIVALADTNVNLRDFREGGL